MSTSIHRVRRELESILQPFFDALIQRIYTFNSVSVRESLSSKLLNQVQSLSPQQLFSLFCIHAEDWVQLFVVLLRESSPRGKQNASKEFTLLSETFQKSAASHQGKSNRKNRSVIQLPEYIARDSASSHRLLYPLCDVAMAINTQQIAANEEILNSLVHVIGDPQSSAPPAIGISVNRLRDVSIVLSLLSDVTQGKFLHSDQPIHKHNLTKMSWQSTKAQWFDPGKWFSLGEMYASAVEMNLVRFIQREIVVVADVTKETFGLLEFWNAQNQTEQFAVLRKCKLGSMLKTCLVNVSQTQGKGARRYGRTRSTSVDRNPETPAQTGLTMKRLVELSGGNHELLQSMIQASKQLNISVEDNRHKEGFELLKTQVKALRCIAEMIHGGIGTFVESILFQGLNSSNDDFSRQVADKLFEWKREKSIEDLLVGEDDTSTKQRASSENTKMSSNTRRKSRKNRKVLKRKQPTRKPPLMDSVSTRVKGQQAEGNISENMHETEDSKASEPVSTPRPGRRSSAEPLEPSLPPKYFTDRPPEAAQDQSNGQVEGMSTVEGVRSPTEGILARNPSTGGACPVQPKRRRKKSAAKKVHRMAVVIVRDIIRRACERSESSRPLDTYGATTGTKRSHDVLGDPSHDWEPHMTHQVAPQNVEFSTIFGDAKSSIFVWDDESTPLTGSRQQSYLGDTRPARTFPRRLGSFPYAPEESSQQEGFILGGMHLADASDELWGRGLRGGVGRGLLPAGSTQGLLGQRAEGGPGPPPAAPYEAIWRGGFRFDHSESSGEGDDEASSPAESRGLQDDQFDEFLGDTFASARTLLEHRLTRLGEVSKVPVVETKDASTQTGNVQVGSALVNVDAESEAANRNGVNSGDQSETRTQVDSVRSAKTQIDSVRSAKTPIDSVRTAKMHIDSVRSAKTPIDSVRTAKTHIDSARTAKTHIDSVRSAKTPIDSVRTAKTHIDSVRSATSQVDSMHTMKAGTASPQVLLVPASPKSESGVWRWGEKRRRVLFKRRTYHARGFVKSSSVYSEPPLLFMHPGMVTSDDKVVKGRVRLSSILSHTADSGTESSRYPMHRSRSASAETAVEAPLPVGPKGPERKEGRALDGGEGKGGGETEDGREDEESRINQVEEGVTAVQQQKTKQTCDSNSEQDHSDGGEWTLIQRSKRRSKSVEKYKLVPKKNKETLLEDSTFRPYKSKPYRRHSSSGMIRVHKTSVQEPLGPAHLSSQDEHETEQSPPSPTQMNSNSEAHVVEAEAGHVELQTTSSQTTNSDHLNCTNSLTSVVNVVDSEDEALSGSEGSATSAKWGSVQSMKETSHHVAAFFQDDNFQGNKVLFSPSIGYIASSTRKLRHHRSFTLHPPKSLADNQHRHSRGGARSRTRSAKKRSPRGANRDVRFPSSAVKSPISSGSKSLGLAGLVAELADQGATGPECAPAGTEGVGPKLRSVQDGKREFAVVPTSTLESLVQAVKALQMSNDSVVRELKEVRALLCESNQVGVASQDGPPGPGTAPIRPQVPKLFQVHLPEASMGSPGERKNFGATPDRKESGQSVVHSPATSSLPVYYSGNESAAFHHEHHYAAGLLSIHPWQLPQQPFQPQMQYPAFAHEWHGREYSTVYPTFQSQANPVSAFYKQEAHPGPPGMVPTVNRLSHSPPQRVQSLQNGIARHRPPTMPLPGQFRHVPVSQSSEPPSATQTSGMTESAPAGSDRPLRSVLPDPPLGHKLTSNRRHNRNLSSGDLGRLRLERLQPLAQLSKEVEMFRDHCQQQRMKRRRSEQVIMHELVNVVKQLWPRATPKAYGSCVTGLSLPGGDIDVVICIPKVMKNAIAEDPGVLEGRNSIKMTWQQNLAEVLQTKDWVQKDTVRIVPHATVPIVSLRTNPVPPSTDSILLDLSFEAENHHGLDSNGVIIALQTAFPMLQPMVLVLKQFLLERGLGKGYTGGLSSYGLLLMVACYLADLRRSDRHVPSGASQSDWLERVPATGAVPAAAASPKKGHQWDYRNDFPLLSRPGPWPQEARAGTRSPAGSQSRVDDSLSDPGRLGWSALEEEEGGLSQLPAVQEDVAPRSRSSSDSKEGAGWSGKAAGGRARAQSMHQVAQAEVEGEERLGSLLVGFLCTFGKLDVRRTGVSVTRGFFDRANSGPDDPAAASHFDPLFLEDPLQFGNNVGKNCFRVAFIQKQFLEAHAALRRVLAAIGTRAVDPPPHPRLLSAILRQVPDLRVSPTTRDPLPRVQPGGHVRGTLAGIPRAASSTAPQVDKGSESADEEGAAGRRRMGRLRRDQAGTCHKWGKNKSGIAVQGRNYRDALTAPRTGTSQALLLAHMSVKHSGNAKHGGRRCAVDDLSTSGQKLTGQHSWLGLFGKRTGSKKKVKESRSQSVL